ncbi:hypothetical protein C6I21_11610 [Alkalicoccus urumqiensis]|uniref:Uncharacterized protein n=1 Tax=Alkalicoccus urumqiensis TaxID=1548213 RepID=A0A2P6MFM2_ALKUR|nr:hypothetical protein C6I21_11610 [Alkalicoccus urumqiensis]
MNREKSTLILICAEKVKNEGGRQPDALPNGILTLSDSTEKNTESLGLLPCETKYVVCWRKNELH